MTTLHSMHQLVYQNQSMQTRTVPNSGMEYSQNRNPNQPCVSQSISGQYQEHPLVVNQITSSGAPNVHQQNLNGINCPIGGAGKTDQNSKETQNTNSEIIKDNSSNVISKQTSLANDDTKQENVVNNSDPDGQNSELYKKYRIVWVLPVSETENQVQGNEYNTIEKCKDDNLNIGDAGPSTSSENDVVTVSIGPPAVINNQISGKPAGVNAQNGSVQSACLATADSSQPPPGLTDNMNSRVLRKTLHDAYRGYKRRSSLQATSFNVAQHSSVEHSQFLSQYKADVQTNKYEPHRLETDINQQFSNNGNIPKRLEDLEASTLQKNKTSIDNSKAKIFLINKTPDDKLNNSSALDTKRKAHEEYINALRKKYLNTSGKSAEQKSVSIRKPSDTTNDAKIQALKEENLKKLNALRQGFGGKNDTVPQSQNGPPWKPRDNNDVNNHPNHNGTPPAANPASNATYTNLGDATKREIPLGSKEGFPKYIGKQGHIGQVSHLGPPSAKTDISKTPPKTQNTSIIDLTEDNEVRKVNTPDPVHKLITQRNWNPHLQIFTVENTDVNQMGHAGKPSDDTSGRDSQHFLPPHRLYNIESNGKQKDLNHFDFRNRVAFLHPYQESQPHPDVPGYQAFRCSINIKKSGIQPVAPEPWGKTPSDKYSLPNFLKRKYGSKVNKQLAIDRLKSLKRDSSELPSLLSSSDKISPSKTTAGKKKTEDALHTVLNGINKCLTTSQSDGTLVNDFRNRGRKKNVDECISEIDSLVNKDSKPDEDVMVLEDFDVDSYMKIEKIG